MPVLFPTQIIISGYNDRKKAFYTSSTSWRPSLFFSVIKNSQQIIPRTVYYDVLVFSIKSGSDVEPQS